MTAPRIEVTGLCSHGWFSRNLTLAQFAHQRANLLRLEDVYVQLVGALA